MTDVLAILTYALGTIWIVGWAIVRAIGPTKGQYLQSDWILGARFIYVIIYLMIFFGGTGFFVFGGKVSTNLASEISGAFPSLNHLRSLLGGEIAPVAPLFSIALIHLGLSFDKLKRLDQRMLDRLHSTEHLDDDLNRLRMALEASPFEPSDIEIAANKRKLEQNDIRITDNNLISDEISLVTQWRKVACLLRFVTSWKAKTPNILNESDEDELREIEKSDIRKIKHAHDIIRALRHSTHQNAELDQALSAGGETTNVATFPGGSDVSPDDFPNARDTNVPAGTLEMGSQEFERYIARIQNYFMAEYKILLHKISRLGAKTIIYSGDHAEQRVENLQTAGFTNLGDLNRLTIDNIIKYFCLTLLIVISIFLISPLILGQTPGSTGPGIDVILKIGLIYAFSVLCGAMIATNRSFTQRRKIPWAAFISAGLISFSLFLLIQFSFALTDALFETISGGHEADIFERLSFGRMQSGETAETLSILDVLPWGLLPAIASIAICRISRVNWSGQVQTFQAILDGLALGAVFIGGFMIVMALHVHSNTPFGHMIYAGQHLNLDSVLMFSPVAGLIGLIMGATTIPDIRRIARSDI